MTWLTSRDVRDMTGLAKSVDNTIVTLLDRMLEWRDQVSATSELDSIEVRDYYTKVNALRRQLLDVAALPPLELEGFIAATVAMFPGQPGYNPVNEFPVVMAALNAFVSWIVDAWPHKLTVAVPGGQMVLPCFERVDPETLSLTRFMLPLDMGGRVVTVRYIDDILTVFGAI